MTTRFIIARHGNTFTPEQTPTRVGARTDLPLTETQRGKAIGNYIKQQGWSVDNVFSGPLLRHTQTASLACQQLKYPEAQIRVVHDFNEIDYGEDENKTEQAVMLRLGAGDLARGEQVIADWNKHMLVPEGWHADPAKIQHDWQQFANTLLTKHRNQTSLLISSNGIIRFAPIITGDLHAFCRQHDMKVSTGGVCVFEYQTTTQQWLCTHWGVKPLKVLPSRL